MLAKPLPPPDPEMPVDRPSERDASGPAAVDIPDTSALDEALRIRTYGTGWEIEWEASPDAHHQLAVDRIRRSVRESDPEGTCRCVHLPDVDIWLGKGTWRRPDVSIWREMPRLPPAPHERPRRGGVALTTVPEAVVEVVSHGKREHADKDLDPSQGPALYLRAGVLDVLVYDPKARETHHHTPDGSTTHPEGTTFQLRCGCTVSI